MPDVDLLTAEQFVAARSDLPDGGRWTELAAGKVVTLSGPEDAHGNVVLNLAKLLAEFSQRVLRETGQTSFAGFELGLILQRRPDTVCCPAVSYFTGPAAFEESDKIVTETRPRVVIEVASSNDRRRDLAKRVTAFLDWGVDLVVVVDTQGRKLYTFDQDRRPKTLAEHDTFIGGGVLSGFRTPVADLFKEPGWWR